jgi:hypothetical protein
VGIFWNIFIGKDLCKFRQKYELWIPPFSVKNLWIISEVRCPISWNLSGDSGIIIKFAICSMSTRYSIFCYMLFMKFLV